MTDIHYLLLSVALTWIMIMTAAELRTPTWTRLGAKQAFGNREELPAASPVAGRAARAATNMVENLVLLLGVWVAARAAGTDATFGTAVFFFSRLAYFGAYVAGIVYLRSLLWAVALLGILWIALSALGLVS